MQKIYDWIKANKVFITIIATLITAVTSVTVQIKGDPNAKNPSIIVVVPESPPDNVSLGKPDPTRIELLKIRIHAATQLAKSEKVSWSKAFQAVNKVKTEDLVACAIKAGFPEGAIGDGTMLQKLVAWFLDPANQEKIKMFIEFLAELGKMFL